MGVVAVAFMATPLAHAAQDDPRVVIALKDADERRRELEPKGIPVVGFMAHGSLETRLTVDDNVIAANRPVADRVLAVVPSLTLVSGPHPWEVRASLSGEDVRHADHAALNYRNLSGAVKVSGESWDRSRAHLAVEWSRRHELPGSTDAPGAASLPVPVDRLTADGALLVRSGRFLFGSAATVTRLGYQDVEAIGGGIIDQRHRDRWEITLSQRAGVAATSMLDVFVETRQGVRRYDRVTPLLGIDRGSVSNDAVIGIALDMTERMAGEVVWGRSQRQHASALFPPHAETIYRGAVKISLTTLTSLTGRAWQSVEETGALLQAVVVETGWRAGVEHELLRQLVLQVDGGPTARRYVGYVGGLEEEDVTIRMAGEYRIDHRWFVGLEGRWDHRTSTVRDAGFERTRTMLRVGARL
ncbi:MAG: outer membrane beta-barrel protein [Rhodospirillaceae bacterium]